MMRHAQAHSVEIELVREGGQLRMTVSDDGQGFCREQTRPTSFGLVGVRERVLMLGGEHDAGKRAGRRHQPECGHSVGVGEQS